MSQYKERFKDRRTGKDRRDWDEFVLKDRRSGKERRAQKERRSSQLPFTGPERRKLKNPPQKDGANTQHRKPKDPYYSLKQVAQKTGVTQAQILEWIYQKRLNDASIQRDSNGHRIFSEQDVRTINKIQKQEISSK